MQSKARNSVGVRYLCDHSSEGRGRDVLFERKCAEIVTTRKILDIRPPSNANRANHVDSILRRAIVELPRDPESSEGHHDWAIVDWHFDITVVGSQRHI